MKAVWTGRAVSENRRVEPGRKRWHNTLAYQGFLDAMTWTLKLANRNRAPIYGGFWLEVKIKLNPRIDPQNLVKPIFDAVEKARIVENDRNVRHFAFDSQPQKICKDDVIEFEIKEMG